MAGSRTRAVVDYAKRLTARFKAHNLTLVSAGAAFYAFLAFIPGLIVFVSVYGLIADPAEVQEQVEQVASALPNEVEQFLKFQLTSIAKAGSTEVSVTLVVALVIALWSASGGMAALVHGIQVAHEQTHGTGYLKRRARALGLTIGAIVMLVLVATITAFLPSLVDDVLGGTGLTLVEVLRWPAVAVVMVLGLGLLYRFADPAGASGWLGFVSRGAVVATLLWLIASFLFSVYTANFASYAKTYGSLAAIVVLLLWLFLSSFSVLMGAEVDALEKDR